MFGAPGSAHRTRPDRPSVQSDVGAARPFPSLRLQLRGIARKLLPNLGRDQLLDPRHGLADFGQMSHSDTSVTPTLDQLLTLETTVWQALADGNAQADRALLLPDFLGVYPSGFSDRDGHAGQMANGPTIAAFSLHDARLLPVGADHAMLSYRARYRRPDSRTQEEMYVSSLWQRGPEGWRNLFSQDTPAER